MIQRAMVIKIFYVERAQKRDNEKTVNFGVGGGLKTEAKKRQKKHV